MNHISAVTTSAPSSLTATANLASLTEHYIGLQVAGAAAVFLLAVVEHGDGGVSPQTQEQSGRLISELYRLQRYTAGQFDFAAVARRQGVALLREGDIDLATAERAVDQVLKILACVVKSRLS